MKNKITERKCKYCDIFISDIPQRIRCLDCHKYFIDNAMTSNKNTKNEDEFLKETRQDYVLNYVLAKHAKQDVIDVDLDDMLYLLLEITHDKRLKGLDYGEKFQVLLEFDEELKNNQNNIINDDEEHNPIQGI